jgi:O-methyltransferase
VKLTPRDRLVDVLRRLRLNRAAARWVYRLEGFKTANVSVVEAAGRALEHVRAEGIAGDYLEFGVFKGASLLHAQQTADRLGIRGMRFLGFDSFAGLPEEPDQKRPLFYAGQYACGEAKVRRWLTRGGADWTRLQLVPGFYDRTLTHQTKRELGLSACAAAMLDCDVASSTELALAWIEDLLVPRAVVVLDDWDAYGDGPESWEDGQRRALRAHAPRSRWTFEPFFRYGAGLRGGQAFLVEARSTSG